MRALQIRDITNHAAIGIDNHDVCSTRDINAMRCRVGAQGIPAAFSAQNDFLDQVIARTLRRGEPVAKKCGDTSNKKKSPKRLAHGVPSVLIYDVSYWTWMT